MNAFYDKVAASTYLESRIAELPRNRGETDVMPLWNVNSTAFEAFAVSEPPSFRLKDVATPDAEEVSFRVRGILCYKQLPPVCHVKNSSSIAFLRQTAQLVTFMPGSRFGDYLQKTNEIVSRFEQVVPGKVNPPTTQLYEGQRALVISNPYFTGRNLTPTMESLALGGNVDPTGYLTRSQPQNFHHTMDNQVLYLKEYIGVNDVKYRILSPERFENGDIVEAQFAYVAFPLAKKKDEYQLRMCLRALVLLDDSFRRESHSTHVNYPQASVPVFNLKRKVAYTLTYGDDMESEGVEASGAKRFCIEQ